MSEIKTFPPSKEGPFSKHLNFDAKMNELHEVVTTLAIEPYHLNVKGLVHGGVIATMVDNIIGDTIATTTGCSVVTINLSINYLASVKGDATLLAKATILQLGYKIATAEGTIVDKEGNLIAKGTGTFKIFRPKKEE